MPSRYCGSNITPFAHDGRTKLCEHCLDRLPVEQMTEVHPVPGLTMYRCPACTALLACAPDPAPEGRP